MLPPAETSPRRSRWRVIFRSLLLVIFALLATVLLLLGALHTRRGMTTAVNLALRVTRPWKGADITIGDARRGFFGGIEVYGVQIRQYGVAFTASIDTLRVGYRLSDLLGRPLRIRSILLAGPNVTATIPFPGEPGPEKAGGGANLAFDRVEIRRGSARLGVRAAGRDSVLELDEVALAGSGIRITRSVSFTLDTLAARLRSPAPPAAEVRIAAAGALAPGRVELRSFAVDGDRTRVSGRGTLAFPTAERRGFDGTDLHVTFAPLAGSDLRRFVPSLGDPGDIALELEARGDSSLLHATLSARSERAGSVQLEARLPAKSGKAMLRTDGKVDGLDLDAILGKDLGKILLSAQWSADLAGPTLARVSGPLRLDLAGTRVRGVRLDRASVDGRFEEGRYGFGLRGAAAGYSLQGTGSVTPLAAPLSYDVTANLTVPPIRTGDSTFVLFAGTAPIRIRGVVPKGADATANATIELRPDSSASPLLGPGSVALDLDSQQLRCRADLSGASGTVHVAGDLRFGGAPAFAIQEGVIRDVDVTRFERGASQGASRDSTPCRLSARVRGRGTGSRLETLHATAEIDSIAFRYGAHEIHDGRAVLRVAGGQAKLETKGLLDGGTVDGWVVVTSWAPPREARAGLTFQDLDLARVTGRKELAFPLGGNLTGSLAHGTVRAEGRLESRGKEDHLQGVLHASATGTDARTLVGQAALDLSGSSIRGITFDRLLTKANLTRGHLDAGVDARADSDSASVRLSAEPFENPIVAHATGSLRSARIAEMAGIDSTRAAARLSFEADALVPRSGGLRDLALSSRIEARASAKHVGEDEARIDSLLVDFALAHGVADVHRLVVRGNVLVADGAGRIVLPGSASGDSSAFQLEGTLGAVEPLAPILGLTNLSVLDGRVRASAAGPPGAMSYTGRAILTHPHVNDFWADSIALDLSATSRDTTLAQAKAHVGARSLVIWPLAPRDLEADLGWNGSEASASIQTRIFGRWPEEIALHVEPRDGGLRGAVDRLVHTRPSGTLALQGPVRFELGKRLSLSDFVLLQNGVPVLRARGGADERAVDFTVHLDSLDLSQFDDLSVLPSVQGWVSLNGTLTGSRARPVADGSWQAKVVPGNRKPATMNGRIRWADGTLDLSGRFEQSAANHLSVDARLPVALTLEPNAIGRAVTRVNQPMSAKLEAKSFDLSWFQPLLSPRQARNIQGWVDGTVTAEGDPDRPTLSGGLALQKARIDLPQLGIKLEDGMVSLGFSGRTVRLERAKLKSGGTLEASGSLILQGPGDRPLDFEVKLHHFTPVNTSQAKAEVDGRIAISGDLDAPRLRSELTLRKTTIYAERAEGGGLEPVTLTRRDRLDLQERFGVGVGGGNAEESAGSSLADSMDLDATVKVGDNVWVRRHSDPVVALELQGDVRMRKPPGRAVDARGTLGIKTGRSYLSFLGRRFEMQRAEVDLPGPVDSASAHLEAFYHPRSNSSSSTEVDVTASVEIEPSGIRTNLRSEPYLDQASLLNYLATGEVQGGLQSGSAYGLAVGTALGAVGGAAGRSLGLDVVTVTTDAYGGQTLGAGSYVNPKVYLGFRQPVVEGKRSGTSSASSTSNTEFEFEIEAMRNLLFNIQGSSSQYRFVLRPRLGR
jgi:hypothetical protein